MSRLKREMCDSFLIRVPKTGLNNPARVTKLELGNQNLRGKSRLLQMILEELGRERKVFDYE